MSRRLRDGRLDPLTSHMRTLLRAAVMRRLWPIPLGFAVVATALAALLP